MAELNLDELPEGCIAKIISFTSPEDAARLSSISRNFKSAADSDSVWGRFLPPETHTILSQSSAPELATMSKKEVYRTLCANPVLIADGRMSFSLDKSSGEKCYMISARQLAIIWGSTPQYWTWTPHPESRFEKVATLLNVCWLEIRGQIDTRLLSPSTQYKAYIVFKFTTEADGFNNLPAQVSVGRVGEEVTRQTVFLCSQGVVMNHDQYPQVRSDGWWEVELGEFFCAGEEGQLEMTLSETIRGNWKRGLIVQGIELRP